MTKNIKKLLASIIVIIMLFAMATFVSIAKFNVSNPFTVANGLFQIIFTDKQYAEIQVYPRVMVAKPEVSLESYMKSNGFTENKEDQLGALHVFERAETKDYVLKSVNKYFAKWHWNE